MNKLFALLLLSLCFLPLASAQYSVSAVSQDSISVMSFNIRYDNPDDPYPWSERKENVAKLISESYQVDLAGLQEVVSHQLDHLETFMPGYDYIGVGRADGIRDGEFCPIFYKKDRFELLAYDTFWLSETPSEAGSKSWDSSLPRIVTWGKFKEIKSGNEFFHFNTHFDHRGNQARLESAKLVLRKVKEIAGDTPAVLTGDFNFRETSAPYPVMIGKADLDEELEAMQDARYVSLNTHQGPTSSTTNWREYRDPETRIDYIFVKNGFAVENHKILDDMFGEFYPSDHLPVLAEIKLSDEIIIKQ